MDYMEMQNTSKMLGKEQMIEQMIQINYFFILIQMVRNQKQDAFPLHQTQGLSPNNIYCSMR